jgi:hypothetical protein
MNARLSSVKLPKWANSANLMGAMVLFIVIWDIAIHFTQFIEDPGSGLVQIAIYVITGVALIAYHHKRPMTTIGIAAVGLGIGMIVPSIPNLLVKGDLEYLLELVMLGDYADVIDTELGFINALLNTSLGLVNLYCGIMCLLKKLHNSNPMIAATGFILGYNIVVYLIMFRITNDIDYIWSLLWPVLPSMVFYVAFLILLNAEEVKKKGDAWKIDHDLFYLRTSICVDGESVMMRDDMKKLLDCINGNGTWDRENVDPIVERESMFALHSRKKADRQLLLQKRRDGKMYLSVINDGNKSYVVGMCTDVNVAICEGDPKTCRFIRIYGTETFMNIRVSDINPSEGKAQKFRRSFHIKPHKAAEANSKA